MRLINKLFLTNPYHNFNEKFELDLQTWGNNEKELNDAIDAIKPSLIIEVGSWKGASAINMAKHIKEIGLDCEIVCVDTWLGSTEHEGAMPVKNGYPRLYYQFLYNVIACGVEGIITPFPNTSTVAYHWFKRENIHPDMVYLDGDHDEDIVGLDISSYYSLLNEGGILIGDDYTWDSVKSALLTFSHYRGVDYELLKESLWVIRK